MYFFLNLLGSEYKDTANVPINTHKGKIFNLGGEGAWGGPSVLPSEILYNMCTASTALTQFIVDQCDPSGKIGKSAVRGRRSSVSLVCGT